MFVFSDNFGQKSALSTGNADTDVKNAVRDSMKITQLLNDISEPQKNGTRRSVCAALGQKPSKTLPKKCLHLL